MVDPGFEAAVRAAPAYPADRFAGRGLVMCAGGARLLTCAWVTLSLLRNELGCTLPIELWHLGPDELGPAEADLFASLDVEPVDAVARRATSPARTLGGWELKSYALSNSRYAEAILLDADNVPVRDPAFLFDADEFRDTGAVFWPDAVQIAKDNPVWDRCGIASRQEPAWESGQVVLDKARTWHALQLTRYLNDHSDTYFTHIHGDKDTYHLAWRRLRQPHGFPRRPRATVYGLLQHDFEGAPLFQHRTLAKWSLHAANPRFADFTWDAECVAHLERLRARWDGRISAKAPPSGLEAELLAISWFVVHEGARAEPLQLLRGGMIGRGVGVAWRHWRVEGQTLELRDDGGGALSLQREGESWAGIERRRVRGRVELRPAPDVSEDPAAGAVAAVLAAVDGGLVGVDAAVTTLVTLARATGREDVAAPRPVGPAAAEALLACRRELGLREPGLTAGSILSGGRYIFDDQ